ncbi:MAG TPA: primosome assembly protein PriA, partial [Mycobacteriales bacterium]|nr:primosome assembly protein PriA [Mycobacteriales bacterium]
VAWECPSCGGSELVPRTAGQARTAEELGRAFPGVAVRQSGGDHVLADVPAGPALVVATPGAEPVAPAPGYGAALLLDGWALLARPDLRAGEEALRRWSAAVALVASDGEVLVVAPDDVPPVQALVRGDPLGHAEREATERAALGFPPAVRIAAIDGPADAVAALLARVALPPGHEVLGPVPRPERRDGRERRMVERVLLRVPRREGAALATALRSALALRAAQRGGRSEGDSLRVQLDPVDLI